MITEHIYILGNDKLEKTKQFIKKEMTSARFVTTPYCIGGQCWSVQLSYNKEDAGKLKPFLNGYKEVVLVDTKKSFFQIIKNLFA